MTLLKENASRRQFLLGAAASGLAIAAGSGLGNAFAQEQKVVFWSQLAGSKKAAGEGLEAAFRSAHPEITLDSSLYADPVQLNEKLLTAISGNTPPDLFIQHWDYTLNYGSGGKLLDLDTALLDKMPADALNSGLLGYCHTDGPNISVPMYGTSRGIGFNRKIVADAGLDPDTPPTNWEELRQWAIAMTQRNGRLLRRSGFWMFGNDLSAWELFVLFLQGAGGSILSDDLKTPTFAGAEGVAALQFLRDLITVDGVTDAGFGVNAGSASGDPFTQGRAGMLIAGNYNINNSLKAGIDFDVMPVPMKDGGGFTSLVDPFCFAIPASSANSAAATTFIEFALAQEQQVAFATTSKNVPVLKAAQQDPAVQADPFLAKFVALAGYAPAKAPAISSYSQMASIVSRAVQDTLYAQSEPKESLEAAAAKVQELL